MADQTEYNNYAFFILGLLVSEVYDLDIEGSGDEEFMARTAVRGAVAASKGWPKFRRTVLNVAWALNKRYVMIELRHLDAAIDAVVELIKDEYGRTLLD